MTVGLIPCAGTASRIHSIPKYLLPLPDGYLLQCLIDRMKRLDAIVHIGANPDNARLVQDYANAYVYRVDSHSTMSDTVLSLFSIIKSTIAGQNYGSENVIFGMPDVWFEDDTCYPKLAAALDNGADVAVALFFARLSQRSKVGMCRIDGNQVVEVVDKPAETDYVWLWGALAWTSAFWQHIRPEDPHVGYALPRAIEAGLDVRAVKCDGNYFDAGTFESYAELVMYLHGRKEASEMTGIHA